MSALARWPQGSVSRAAATLRGAEVWLLRIAWAALVVVALLAVLAPGLFGLSSVLDGGIGRLLGCIALYGLSHAARFARLALLVHHPGISVRRVLQVHLLTTGLGVLLPFKLSEIVRVREVGVITGSLRTGLLAVWLERTFDFCILLVLVLVTAVGIPDSLGTLTPLLALMTTFVIVTVVLIAVVPENLRGLMLHLVRRPYGERSVTALRWMRAALSMLHEAPSLVRNRLPTLALLSVIVWAAEVAVISIALPGIDLRLSELSTAMLALLSSVSTGATPLMPGFGEDLADALGSLALSADVGVYRAALALFSVVGAAWAASHYVPWRTRASAGRGA